MLSPSITNSLTETDIHDIIEHVEKTFPERSDIVMTLAERLVQKGRREGKIEGKKEGATNALAKTAKNRQIRRASS